MTSILARSTLCICLLGPVSVHINGAPMRKLRTRAGDWLLALLTLREGKPVSRDWLAETLWPESMASTARDNLRRCLSDLRGALGEEARRITSPTRETLYFDIAGASVDAFDLDAALEGSAECDIEFAAANHAASLLKSCSAEWTAAERDRRRCQYVAALERWAGLAEERGDIARACDLLRRGSAEDPLNEDLTVRLMGLLASMGEFDQALTAYRDLHGRLSRMVRDLPTAETAALYYGWRRTTRGAICHFIGELTWEPDLAEHGSPKGSEPALHCRSSG